VRGLDDHGQAALDQVVAARTRGATRRAIELATLLINRGPAPDVEVMLRIERARSYSRESEWLRAESDCRRALALSGDAAAQVLLAESLLEQKRSAEATALLEAGERAAPRLRGWRASYARALSAEARHSEACDAAERAHGEDPSSLTVRLHVLAAAGRHAELIELARHALEAGPAPRADVCTLLGLSLDAQGRSREAAAALREAVALEPERVDANCGLGMALLRLGDYEGGFRHCEYRQRATGRVRLGVPPWRGESLAGKHLVVRAEQGNGDTLQFARFLPLVRETAQRTTLLAPPSLLRLLRSTPALGDVQSGHPGFGFGDYQTLVMSLPHHLGLARRIAAAPARYLFPEPELVERWRRRLPRGPKVALAWQGNPMYAGDPWRSMPFAHYASLLARYENRVTFLSLQKNAGREQLQALPFSSRVLDLADEIDAEGDAYVDSLAVLSQVDLFVTTDNGLAHVAGGAGVPTWVLLGTVPDWRWGTAEPHTPWYQSLRLFRQSTAGDWDRVVARVADELERELFGRASSP
jgi:tetratricopeptide (TPR) repeat protein